MLFRSIGYEEVKMASTPDEIVVLNRTIKANNEKITAEKKIKDDELKVASLIAEKEKKQKEFCEKYSFKNFLLAIQLPIVFSYSWYMSYVVLCFTAKHKV